MSRGSVEEFMRRVEVTDGGCWNWTGGHREDGYGLINWNGHLERAHRVSYEIHVGPIPRGAILRHDCDNPPCVNPAHLRHGTHADNMADKVKRGRARGGGHIGETHHQAKLREVDVLSIRLAVRNGEQISALSRKYGVTRTAIRHVANRVTWRHLPD